MSATPTTDPNQPISAEFPFDSHYVEVHGSKMHYVEQGSGDPVLFLHGNPTSSYLWRNIIPHLSDSARCIAPDLIGMGKSDKPDIPYRFFDHVKYLDGFIAALDLKNITLVVHDWGSGLGFHYATRHPDNVKAIAFMEAIIRPMEWSAFAGPAMFAFRGFRTDGVSWLMISVLNLFVKGLLPGSVVRKLTAGEKQTYSAPYPTIRSRRPVRQWPREVPLGGKPEDVVQAAEAWASFLTRTDKPKLMFYAEPGAIINKDAVAWAEANMPNLRTVFLGKGLHYLQEDHPHTIGATLREWYTGLG